MTGAAIPEGCNAVVMLELTEGFEENEKIYMVLKRSFSSGDNISLKGEDVNQNSILVKKGLLLILELRLLATFGYNTVYVVKQPVIGIVTTGSELLEVHEQLKPGKIRNSNSYMVAAQIERAGGVVQYYGQFADNFETCYNTVKKR